MKTLVVVSLVYLTSPILVVAQEGVDWSDWTMGSPYIVELDLFHPNLDTGIRID